MAFLWSLEVVLGAFILIMSLGAMAHANTLTVNVAQKGGPLKKAGLGSLFEIVTNNVGAWKYYMMNSFLYVSEPQTRIGEGTSISSGTSVVAPVIRGSKIRMMWRFGGLCYGWASCTWPGLIIPGWKQGQPVTGWRR